MKKIRQFWLLRGDVTNLLRSRHRVPFAVAPLELAVTNIAGWNYCFILKLEIRDSQNLAKLGLGGKPSLLVL